MKQFMTVPKIIGAVLGLALVGGCQTASTNQAELAASRTEFLLAQSGFKVITVTTPKQQRAIKGLPQGRVSAVKYNGKLFYVFPTATQDRIYVGKQKQFEAYKKAAVAQQTSQQAQPGQSTMNPPPTMTFQGHGQQQIVAEQFDGFGPMGTAQLGDW
ncbi:MAG TPA: hypothetical protein VGM65_17215 [Candidatus Udaeobacter sp.]|jgi:hypothetical protein